MLGRLRMDIKSCQEAYATLAREVFGKRKHGIGEGTFKATNLKDVIQKTVNEQKLGDKMMDNHEKPCKVSVSHV